MLDETLVDRQDLAVATGTAALVAAQKSQVETVAVVQTPIDSIERVALTAVRQALQGVEEVIE